MRRTRKFPLEGIFGWRLHCRHIEPRYHVLFTKKQKKGNNFFTFSIKDSQFPEFENPISHSTSRSAFLYWTSLSISVCLRLFIGLVISTCG
jgi:hypothetical protein